MPGGRLLLVRLQARCCRSAPAVLCATHFAASSGSCPTDSSTANEIANQTAKAQKAEDIESERTSAAAVASFDKLNEDQQDPYIQRHEMVLKPGIELPTTRTDGAIQGGRARLRGLAGKPELNGSMGRLIGLMT